MRFITYLRVSTDKQGRSGLGLEAQREAVARYVAGQEVGSVVVAEYEEVESGKRVDRPALALALSACRAHKATLLIAKVDRLARNALFLLTVVRDSGEGGVAFCDLPNIPPGPVGKFLLTQMAAVAELEAGMISQRTKAALAVVKARGVKLGNPLLLPGDRASAQFAADASAAAARRRAADVLPVIRQAQAGGASSLKAIAQILTEWGVPTPGGAGGWHRTTVMRVLAYAKAAAAA